MGDQQGGAALQQAADGFLNFIFGRAIDGTGRVIQDKDARVCEEGAGDGDALALSTGQG